MGRREVEMKDEREMRGSRGQEGGRVGGRWKRVRGKRDGRREGGRERERARVQVCERDLLKVYCRFLCCGAGFI